MRSLAWELFKLVLNLVDKEAPPPFVFLFHFKVCDCSFSYCLKELFPNSKHTLKH